MGLASLSRDYLDRVHPLSPSARQAFLSLFVLRTHDAGVALVKAGQRSTRIGLLTEGVARAFYCDPIGGKEYNKTFYLPVGFMGAYSALVTGAPSAIDIAAITPLTVWWADYGQVVSLFDSYPAVERLARRLAEGYFVAKERREIELVMLSAGERYERFLLRHPGVEQDIAQFHIASYLGVTPTQLSRIRRQRALTSR